MAPKSDAKLVTAVAARVGHARRRRSVLQNLCKYLPGLERVGESGAGSGKHWRKPGATTLLLALQARDRVRGQVRSGLYVLADGRSEAAPEVNSAADLFLSAMRGVAGNGASAGGRAEYGGVGDDPRVGQRRTVTERSGVGKSAGNGGIADCR